MLSGLHASGHSQVEMLCLAAWAQCCLPWFGFKGVICESHAGCQHPTPPSVWARVTFCGFSAMSSGTWSGDSRGGRSSLVGCRVSRSLPGLAALGQHVSAVRLCPPQAGRIFRFADVATWRYPGEERTQEDKRGCFLPQVGRKEGRAEGRHVLSHGSQGTPERTEQRFLVFGLIKWNMKGNIEPGGACLITSL